MEICDSRYNVDDKKNSCKKTKEPSCMDMNRKLIDTL